MHKCPRCNSSLYDVEGTGVIWLCRDCGERWTNAYLNGWHDCDNTTVKLLHIEELILATIDQDITLSHAFASYWQAMAITGVAKDRKLYHGVMGKEFTDDEKIADAMLTSLRHIEGASKLINKKKSLLIGETDEEDKG